MCVSGTADFWCINMIADDDGKERRLFSVFFGGGGGFLIEANSLVPSERYFFICYSHKYCNFLRQVDKKIDLQKTRDRRKRKRKG